MEVFSVFISYSRKDIEQVSHIKTSIEKVIGCKCWMDLKSIESGSKRFTKDIICGINTCKVFLFMLSKNSQHSEFALRELDYADKKGKHVVIVNVDDCSLTDEFQFLYGLTDTISWNDSPQQEKLLRDMKRWVGVTFSMTATNTEHWESERQEAEHKTREVTEHSVVFKKKRKALGWIIAIILALIIAGLVVKTQLHYESSELKLAKENVPAYIQAVESCQLHINEGKYGDYQPLLTARKELETVKQFEDQGKNLIPETYNHFSDLNSQLESKCIQIGRQYEDFALELIDLDDQLSLECFEIVKKLIPTYNSTEYKKVREKQYLH